MKTSKKKLAIVTLFGLYNYGNRLQNLAVNEIYKKYGFDCVTLLSQECTLRNILKLVRDIICKGNWRIVSSYLFNRKYIPTRVIKGKPLLFPSSLSKEYDYFIVGSDQVWNPEIRQNQRPNFFLQFADKNQRLTISPSIAVSQIPDDLREVYKEGFEGFNYISVREGNSVRIVKDICDKPVFHTIDPTLVLTKQEWLKFEKKVKLPPKYIVSMFLGEIPDDVALRINDLANKNSSQIVSFRDEKWHNLGPDGFLYVIHHANAVFTDSFHCLVFSLIFETPFVACERKSGKKNDVTLNVSSRIYSLLEQFGVSERFFSNIDNVDPFSMDFCCVRSSMETERHKFYEFVKLQLGLND